MSHEQHQQLFTVNNIYYVKGYPMIERRSFETADLRSGSTREAMRGFVDYTNARRTALTAIIAQATRTLRALPSNDERRRDLLTAYLRARKELDNVENCWRCSKLARQCREAFGLPDPDAAAMKELAGLIGRNRGHRPGTSRG